MGSKETIMNQKKGFFLLEVALALLIISVLWCIVAKTVLQIAQNHHELKMRMQALETISNYCEQLRRNQSIMPHSSSIHSITTQQRPLKHAGQWSISLTPGERKLLCRQVNCFRVAVEWKGAVGINRSYELFLALQHY